MNRWIWAAVLIVEAHFGASYVAPTAKGLGLLNIGPARIGRFDVTAAEWSAFRAAAAAQGVRPSKLLGEVIRNYLKSYKRRS